MKLQLGGTWPSRLNDARAIAEYIEQYSSAAVDADDIEELFRGCHAVLRSLPTDRLLLGDEDHNVQSKRNQKRYDALPSATRPPVVVDNWKVMDGNHRVRSALKHQEPTVLAYTIQD